MKPKFKVGDIIEDQYAIEEVVSVGIKDYGIKLIQLKGNVSFDEPSYTTIDIEYTDYAFVISKRYIWYKEINEIING